MTDKEQQVTSLLKQLNVELSYQVDFPSYKVLPDEVQLALKVLSRHGMKINIVLTDVANK